MTGDSVRIASTHGNVALTSESTGSVLIASGDNGGSSSDVTVRSGSSSTSLAGSVIVEGGAGASGNVALSGGASSTGVGGTIKIMSGRGVKPSTVDVAVGASSTVGGTLNLLGGDGADSGGDVRLSAGQAAS
ncbi:hypothetical protein AeRB84_009273, partial [Aphanomyces euteiches]